MLTPEGHTVVKAAHIKPWHKSHDELGLALCRLCHWSFDEGLMGVGNDYEVLVSKRVRFQNTGMCRAGCRKGYCNLGNNW